MIRSPEVRDSSARRDTARAAGYALTAVTAFCVVTCAAAAQAPPAAMPPESVADASESPQSAPEQPSIASPAGSAPPAASGAPTELRRVAAALGELANGTRQHPVRIAWLGDSHAAADFWPNVVRKTLQGRFGKGGPGFIYVGLKVYRHDGVLVTRTGDWHQRPRAPSLWTVQGDGIYGLGGIRSIPAASQSSALLTPADQAIVGSARWRVSYRLPSGDARFRLKWDGGSRVVDGQTAQPDAHGIAATQVETAAKTSLIIDGAAGEPEIFGVTLESEKPGVVLDTLGINGARIGTPLAWEADAWIEQVKARAPALAVLAYGANEAGDAVAPSRYGEQFDELVGRLRRAQPTIDCWIIGPVDRAAANWETLPRVVEIEGVQRQAAERLGCAFTSALAAMGGKGSLKRWAEQSPPLAGSDRVHLTPLGYKKLGTATANELLSLLDLPPTP